MANGGFAAGLAQGIGAGVGLNNQMGLMDLQKRRMDRLEQADDREAEEHEWKKADRDNALKQLSGLADTMEGLYFRTDGSGAPMNIAPQQDSVAFKPLTERPIYGLGGIKGFAEGGLIQATDDVFAGRRTPSNVGGLADTVKSQQVAPQPPQDNLSPNERIAKVMLTTDFLSDPDKLSKVQAYAEANGLGKMITPFLERAYVAKQRGLIDGAQQLMRGQVDEAIDSLKRGGVKLADRPKRIEGNKWLVNIEGSSEREMDIGELLQSTLEPDKFLDFQMKQNESQGKRNVSDAQVRAQDASARRQDSAIRVDNARIGKLGEETKTIRENRALARSGGLGDGSGGSKLPSQAALAEWMVANGVAKDKADAWGKVKTLGDKSPEAAKMELVQSILKSGLVEPADAVKQADQIIAALNPAPTSQSVPQKKVLVFGKDFN